MNGMRVAYLHYLYGEDTALHHVRQFAAAARRLGAQVDVHAMNLAPPDVGDGGDGGDGGAGGGGTRSARLRRALKRRWGRYLHEPKEVVWNARYLRRETALLRAARPDVVLVRDHALTASAVVAAARLDLPLVLELNAPARELALYFGEYFHYPLLPEWIEGWKLRRAGAVTAVSAALKDFLLARHALREESVTVVPNGADLAAFHPGVPPDAEVRAAFGGRPVVGFAGSFQAFHGAGLLAEMTLRVAAARPAACFLFVGDGPEAAAVRARTAPLGERVRFTGRVPHERVPALVAAFDVGVLPETAFYASPLKVMEWMAAGRAVAAPAYGTVREILDDGATGLLFPPRDLDALVAAVLLLVDRPGLRHTLGQAAAARARAALSWDHNAGLVLAVCARAAARRGGAA